MENNNKLNGNNDSNNTTLKQQDSLNVTKNTTKNNIIDQSVNSSQLNQDYKVQIISDNGKIKSNELEQSMQQQQSSQQNITQNNNSSSNNTTLQESNPSSQRQIRTKKSTVNNSKVFKRGVNKQSMNKSIFAKNNTNNKLQQKMKDQQQNAGSSLSRVLTQKIQEISEFPENEQNDSPQNNQQQLQQQQQIQNSPTKKNIRKPLQINNNNDKQQNNNIKKSGATKKSTEKKINESLHCALTRKKEELQKKHSVSDMNKTELKTFAFQLGVLSEQSFKNYIWLLYQFIQDQLPQDIWDKEVGPDGLVVYYNKQSQEVHKYHPYFLKYEHIFEEFKERRMKHGENDRQMEQFQQQMIEKYGIKSKKFVPKQKKIQLNKQLNNLQNNNQNNQNKNQMQNNMNQPNNGNGNNNVQVKLQYQPEKQFQLSLDNQKQLQELQPLLKEIQEEFQHHRIMLDNQLNGRELQKRKINSKNQNSLLAQGIIKNSQVLMNLVQQGSNNTQNSSQVPPKQSNNLKIPDSKLKEKEKEKEKQQVELYIKSQKFEQIEILADQNKKQLEALKQDYQDFQSENQLVVQEEILREATKYYLDWYGLSIERFKLIIKEKEQYKRCDPDEVANAIIQLNIASHETEYYWLGRGWLALELPDFWESMVQNNDRGEVYIFKPKMFKLMIHPGYYFMLMLCNKLKERKNRDYLFDDDYSDKPYLMSFYDKIGRQHDIDMKALLKEKEQEIMQNPNQALYNTGLKYIEKENENTMYKQQQMPYKIRTQRDAAKYSIKITNFENNNQELLEDNNSQSNNILSSQFSNQSSGSNNMLVLPQNNSANMLDINKQAFDFKNNNNEENNTSRPSSFQIQDQQQQQQKEKEKEKKEFVMENGRLVYQYEQQQQQNNEDEQQSDEDQDQENDNNINIKIQSNIQDRYLLSLAKIFKIKLPEEGNLFSVVIEFLNYQEEKSMYKKQKWHFRQINKEDAKEILTLNFYSSLQQSNYSYQNSYMDQEIKQDFYWVNLDQNKAQYNYPYQEELQKLIDLFRNLVKKEQKNYTLKNGYLENLMGNFSIQNKDDPMEIYQGLKKVAKDFVKAYILQYQNQDNVYDVDLNEEQKLYLRNDQQDQNQRISQINKESFLMNDQLEQRTIKESVIQIVDPNNKEKTILKAQDYKLSTFLALMRRKKKKKYGNFLSSQSNQEDYELPFKYGQVLSDQFIKEQLLFIFPYDMKNNPPQGKKQDEGVSTLDILNLENQEVFTGNFNQNQYIALSTDDGGSGSTYSDSEQSSIDQQYGGNFKDNKRIQYQQRQRNNMSSQSSNRSQQKQGKKNKEKKNKQKFIMENLFQQYNEQIQFQEESEEQDDSDFDQNKQIYRQGKPVQNYDSQESNSESFFSQEQEEDDDENQEEENQFRQQQKKVIDGYQDIEIDDEELGSEELQELMSSFTDLEEEQEDGDGEDGKEKQGQSILSDVSVQERQFQQIIERKKQQILELQEKKKRQDETKQIKQQQKDNIQQQQQQQQLQQGEKIQQQEEKEVEQEAQVEEEVNEEDEMEKMLKQLQEMQAKYQLMGFKNYSQGDDNNTAINEEESTNLQSESHLNITDKFGSVQQQQQKQNQNISVADKEEQEKILEFLKDEMRQLKIEEKKERAKEKLKEIKREKKKEKLQKEGKSRKLIKAKSKRRKGINFQQDQEKQEIIEQLVKRSKEKLDLNSEAQKANLISIRRKIHNVIQKKTKKKLNEEGLLEKMKIEDMYSLPKEEVLMETERDLLDVQSLQVLQQCDRKILKRRMKNKLQRLNSIQKHLNSGSEIYEYMGINQKHDTLFQKVCKLLGLKSSKEQFLQNNLVAQGAINNNNLQIQQNNNKGNKRSQLQQQQYKKQQQQRELSNNKEKEKKKQQQQSNNNKDNKDKEKSSSVKKKGFKTTIATTGGKKGKNNNNKQSSKNEKQGIQQKNNLRKNKFQQENNIVQEDDNNNISSSQEGEQNHLKSQYQQQQGKNNNNSSVSKSQSRSKSKIQQSIFQKQNKNKIQNKQKSIFTSKNKSKIGSQMSSSQFLKKNNNNTRKSGRRFDFTSESESNIDGNSSSGSGSSASSIGSKSSGAIKRQMLMTDTEDKNHDSIYRQFFESDDNESVDLNWKVSTGMQRQLKQSQQQQILMQQQQQQDNNKSGWVQEKQRLEEEKDLAIQDQQQEYDNLENDIQNLDDNLIQLQTELKNINHRKFENQGFLHKEEIEIMDQKGNQLVKKQLQKKIKEIKVAIGKAKSIKNVQDRHEYKQFVEQNQIFQNGNNLQQQQDGIKKIVHKNQNIIIKKDSQQQQQSMFPKISRSHSPMQQNSSNKLSKFQRYQNQIQHQQSPDTIQEQEYSEMIQDSPLKSLKKHLQQQEQGKQQVFQLQPTTQQSQKGQQGLDQEQQQKTYKFPNRFQHKSPGRMVSPKKLKLQNQQQQQQQQLQPKQQQQFQQQSPLKTTSSNINNNQKQQQQQLKKLPSLQSSHSQYQSNLTTQHAIQSLQSLQDIQFQNKQKYQQQQSSDSDYFKQQQHQLQSQSQQQQSQSLVFSDVKKRKKREEVEQKLLQRENLISINLINEKFYYTYNKNHKKDVQKINRDKYVIQSALPTIKKKQNQQQVDVLEKQWVRKIFYNQQQEQNNNNQSVFRSHSPPQSSLFLSYNNNNFQQQQQLLSKKTGQKFQQKFKEHFPSTFEEDNIQEKQKQYQKEEKQFRDNMSQLKINRIFYRLQQNNSEIKMTFFQKNNKNNKKSILEVNAQQLQQQSKEQLEILKYKYCKQQVDRIIYYFLIEKVFDKVFKHLQFGKQQTDMKNSDIFQQEFFRNHRGIFQQMRILVFEQQGSEDQIRLVLQGMELQSEFKENLVEVFEMFFRNNLEYAQKSLDEKSVQFQNKILRLKNIYQQQQKQLSQQTLDSNKSSAQLEDLQEEGEGEGEQDLVKGVFNIVSTQIFQEILYGPMLEEEKKHQKELKELQKNRKMKKQLVKNQLKVQYKRYQYISNQYRNSYCLEKYSQLIQFIEKLAEMEQKNPIIKALQQEIGQIHQLQYYNSTKKYEMYLDGDLKVEYIEKMAQKLSIDLYEFPDLAWIPYMYCLFLVKYSSSSSNNDNKEQNSVVERSLKAKDKLIYDDYFEQVFEFAKIRRFFVLNKMQNQRQNYINLQSYVKFFDQKRDQYFWFRFGVNNNSYQKILVKERIQEFSQFQKNQQLRYRMVEKICVQEILEGLSYILCEEQVQIQQQNQLQLEQQQQQYSQKDLLQQSRNLNNQQKKQEGLQQFKHIQKLQKQNMNIATDNNCEEKDDNLLEVINQQ